MKKLSREQNMDSAQELERFKAASARLVKRAEKDPNFARELMRATGYFDMMPQAAKTTDNQTRKTSRNLAAIAPALKAVPALKIASSPQKTVTQKTAPTKAAIAKAANPKAGGCKSGATKK